MIERVVVSNKQPPTLEQRIVSILANDQAGSEAVMELLAEVEAAVTGATLNVEAERAKAVDLVQSPDPREAHQRVVAAELTRDQLHHAIPRLRDKLAGALEAERHARWLSEYREVKTERDALVEEFADTYPRLASELVDLFNRVQQCDRKCSEVDAQASNLNAEHRRLGKVELRARHLEAFSRDRPEIAKTVQLPDFVESNRMRWPVQTSTSFAAEFASSMAAPYHPGPRWADDDVRQQRKAEGEKQHREMTSYYEQATKDEEDRKNREERERFAQAHKRV